MIKFITKKENGQIGISLVIDLSEAKQKISDINGDFYAFREKTEKNISLRFKILGAMFQALFNKPEVVSVKSKDGHNSLFLKWQERPKSVSSDNQEIPEISDETALAQAEAISQEAQDPYAEPVIKKKHLVKGAASLSIIALIIQTCLLGGFLGFAPKIAEAQELCSVDVDVVLVMDVSGSMDDGEAPSRCEWSEIKPYGDSSTWFLNKKYNVSEDWCQNIKDSFDESAPVFQFIPLNYTPGTNKKINDAKAAANSFIIDNLQSNDNDQSALVSFSDSAVIDKILNNDHQATKDAVGALTTGGATNIGGAIEKGIEVLEGNNPKANKIMILLTDGMANKMTDPDTGLLVGPGNGEWKPAVDYAKSKATEAANLGYKIFTVGLGSNSDINEIMLRNIASTTGATYHHAPNGNDLSDIYDDIAYEMCQYGSISGCKFNDLNGNGTVDPEDLGLENWEIVLSGDASDSQLTDSDGCYTFAGLLEGNYTVSETPQSGWTQTYPADGFYEISLAEGEDAADIDFSNYLPVCGNDILDEGEECDGGENCSDTCQIETSEPFCGNGQIEQGEVCDDGNIEDGDGCSSVCQLELSEYACSNGIDDDGDGLIDYPDDPGCESGQDEDETNEVIGIQPGDIVINEIMQHPTKAPWSKGEWFEVYNTTGADIDLLNCSISDIGGNFHVIHDSLTVLSHDYAVLGVNNDLGLNGGVNVDYVYSLFILGDNDDEIILTCDSVEIDRVEYDGGPNFPNPTGASMILANPLLDNDIGANWCESSSAYGLGDLGTPGALNDPCAGLCELSLSGYKFDESNNGLVDWEIQLKNDSGSVLATTTTDINGQYSFNGLCAGGNYRVEEVLQSGWSKISPDSYWEFILGSSTTTIDFINQQTPEPIITGSISGYKYKDADNMASTTGDWVGLENWTINLFVASTTAPISATSTDNTGFFEFNNLSLGDYALTEDLPADWSQLLAPAVISLSTGAPTSTDNNFVNYYNEPEPEPEPVLTGGGGGGIVYLDIFNENNGAVDDTEAAVSWFTNKAANSRIIYDTVSHPDSALTSLPNFGYAYSTAQDNNLLTYREFVIGDLSACAAYYWRAISSDGSTTVFGRELSFKTIGCSIAGEEPGLGQAGGEPGGGTEGAAGGAAGGTGSAGPTEEVVVEEPVGEEEPVEEPIVVEQPQPEKAPSLLASILAALNPFQIGGLCWLLVLAITVLVILYLLLRGKKEKKENQRDLWAQWDLWAMIIALIILAFILECYYLFIPFLIIIGYLLYQIFLKKEPEETV